MADWLRELKQQLGEDDTFFEQMDRQLAPPFEAAVGERLADFVLTPPLQSAGPDRVIVGRPARRFVVRQEGARYRLDGELLNIDYLAPVTIAWERMDTGTHFWWQHLDADDIRSWLSARRDIPIHTQAAIQTVIRNPVWPHVTLAFDVEDGAAERRLEEALHATINAWDPARGAIHNAGPLRRIGPRTFLMSIDFGSAGVDALNHLLDEVARTIQITKVTLDSRP